MIGDNIFRNIFRDIFRARPRRKGPPVFIQGYQPKGDKGLNPNKPPQCGSGVPFSPPAPDRDDEFNPFDPPPEDVDISPKVRELVSNGCKKRKERKDRRRKDRRRT